MTSFCIISDQPDFLIINKAPNISVHKDDQAAGLTMLLAQYLGYPVFLVHRLDKITSGVMVFAKSSVAAAQLAEQFKARSVEKYYIALTTKKPNKKQGCIRGDMAKSRRSAWKLIKSTLNPAITRFISASIKPGVRLFLVKPDTGKTHQIRVALKSIGAPIIGDELYGSLHSDRTYLHAWQLTFNFNGQVWHFIADPTWGDLFQQQEVNAQLGQWAEPSQMKWPS